jgi:uncharacterized phage protein gp47/JayE
MTGRCGELRGCQALKLRKSSLLLERSNINNSIPGVAAEAQLHHVAPKHGAAAQSVAHRRIGKVGAVHYPDAAR